MSSKPIIKNKGDTLMNLNNKPSTLESTGSKDGETQLIMSEPEIEIL